MFNMSVAIAPPADSRQPGPSGDATSPVVWAELDRLWDVVAAGHTESVLDVTRLYQARTVGSLAEPQAAAFEVTPAILRSLSVSPDIAAMNPGLVIDEFVIWELPSPLAEAERRLLVIGLEGRDAELSAWTWSRGDAAMPPLARYLMHAARVRYQERVWGAERERVERLAKRMTEMATAIQGLIDAAADSGSRDELAGRLSVAGLLERIQATQAEAAVVLTEVKAMQQSVAIAVANMTATLIARVPEENLDLTGTLIGRDQALADWLVHQLDDSAAHLERAQQNVRRAAGIASRILSKAGDTGPATSAPTITDRQLATLKGRLEEAISAHDIASLLDPSVLAEGQRLTEAMDDAGDLEAQYLLGWLHWLRYLVLPEGKDSSDLETSINMFQSCFISGMDGLPEPLLPILAERAVPAAVLLSERALNPSDSVQLTRSISLWYRIVDSTPLDDIHRAMWLSNLGVVLRTRFERTGNAADLDAAIEAGRAAADAIPADHPDRPAALSNLGVALRTRFERTPNAADLDAAIEAGRAAIFAAPADHPDRPAALSNLAGTLQARYHSTEAARDLNAAIDAARTAVDAVPPSNPERTVYLSNLGVVLRTRFERTGNAADLDAAIEAGRAAADAIPADHPDRPAALSNLGVALRTRFERTRNAVDLDAAIEAYRAAIASNPANHPDRAAVLTNLDEALQARNTNPGI
jgi:tetratricopeptide (TPR) repeat protein